MLSPRKPAGLLKWGYNLPRFLYRWRLGWVLGHRFLLVTHRVRKTGRPRQTLLEEVAHYDPETDECVVIAAYGQKSDWYQNIRDHPALEVQVGRARYTPVQRDLSPEEILFTPSVTISDATAGPSTRSCTDSMPMMGLKRDCVTSRSGCQPLLFDLPVTSAFAANQKRGTASPSHGDAR